ncbi:hypothetical protein SDC9_134085 [bioreactor metagenome]|uniref:Helicase ATP-binding domain-containing protein n=1 Tax=bioreactor metagenome TaxID=1076179 RepID=A0A645DEI1_9ZZZZ
MNPDETLYFANPGEEGKFNPDYYFHWADFDNEPIKNWKDISDTLLSIPMAHQLIGYYTIPDSTDNVLKVMRSYQYFAANEISDRVAQMNWQGKDARGGYVWHTTGSGKTMTSFKSAQLIASSGDADKVVFLIDRIELGTQSLGEFKGFADNEDDVQGTESTRVLITKLKSDLSSDTLIVTSIQKMSNIKEDGAKQSDIDTIQSKRIVFIVDEAHLLDKEMLEEVRFLLNFKMDAESPMTLILVGQSELWDKLQLQAYAAIRQRIDLQCKLPHLDRSQVGEYIQRHLAYAGADHDIFTDSAVDEIFKFSSGTARLINKVCTHCLLYGAQNGKRIIDDHMVKLVIQGELT